MMSPPGFFSFRWQPERPAPGLEDIAVVFKVPGVVDRTVLPDLIETVCLGPNVPSAVVMLQFGQGGLVDALEDPSVKAALRRFNGRMPLFVYTIQPTAQFLLTLDLLIEATELLEQELSDRIARPTEWIQAGLASVFDPKKVIMNAPSGYAFLKPSGDRSTYFLRAELGLSSSAAVAFVAFAILQRLLKSYGRIPQELRLLLVDTMNVAAVAFALRELLSLVEVQVLPQVESFHSYDGLNDVISPLPDTSLCIVSASSSMNLHRKWLLEKSLSARDCLTLVTFEDAKNAEHALYSLPSNARPEASPPSSAHDIRIDGEYFLPVLEEPRKVLLTTTVHGCQDYTRDFYALRERRIFGSFRAGGASGSRRSLFLDANALLNAWEFRFWVDEKVPQLLKAGTAQVIFQDDEASRILAQHIAYIAETLGCAKVLVRSASEVNESTVDRSAPIVCVAAVVGRGNALLSLSRDLRNCHVGARLYVIGMQVVENVAKLKSFDRNLTHSSHHAKIDVLRRNAFLSSDAVIESFENELKLYSQQHPLEGRRAELSKGLEPGQLFLPSGPKLKDALILNVDFAFWSAKYQPAAYQAEVLGTIAAVLQNARTSELKVADQELRSALLMHVALDPENFARFNEGIIQASILRAALPSELDYRADVQASSYMATLLGRVASKFDQPQIATLEFLSALSTKRMQLTVADTAAVKRSFEEAIQRRSNEMSRAVRFFLDSLPSASSKREAF